MKQENEIIRIIRQRTKLTQIDFAKNIDRNPKTFQDYEYGRINVSKNM